MNDIYAHKLQMAAAQIGTPLAKANADIAAGQLRAQNSQLLQQNAIRATVLKSLQNGGSGLDPIDLGHAGLVPPEQAQKEQASINSQRQAIANVNGLYKQADQEQTTKNLLNPESSRRVETINAALTNAVMESDASKRLTPESAKLEVAPFWVKTTDNADVRAQKNAGLLNLIKTKHAGETPSMEKYAPKAIPKYIPALGSSSSNPMEGKTASGPNGQRIIMQNGNWVPLGK